MAPQAPASQQDPLSSSFSRTPMTSQFSTQKDVLSSSFSRASALMSSAATPLTSQTELSSLDVPAATTGSYTTNSESFSNLPIGSMTTTTTSALRRTEATSDPARAPAYLDNVTAKDVGDWITCRAPIPETIGMPFRRLQSRLGLFNPDKLVTPMISKKL